MMPGFFQLLNVLELIDGDFDPNFRTIPRVTTRHVYSIRPTDIFCLHCFTAERNFTRQGGSWTPDLCGCGCEDTITWEKMSWRQRRRARAKLTEISSSNSNNTSTEEPPINLFTDLFNGEESLLTKEQERVIDDILLELENGSTIRGGFTPRESFIRSRINFYNEYLRSYRDSETQAKIGVVLLFTGWTLFFLGILPYITWKLTIMGWPFIEKAGGWPF